MSLLFYAWGEHKFVFIMLLSIAFNTVMAIHIENIGNDEKNKSRKTVMLFFAVFVNLGILFVFKYLNFAILNINRLGFDFTPTAITLPIGISFFTFQAMSYVIDVYRGDCKANKNPMEVALYISFFPQLIAGPIVRYKDIAEQINNRSHSFDKFSDGVVRFIIGFSKKILIANNCAYVADMAFDAPERSVAMAWLGAIAYSFQILFDFSGYSDMAIGLGKMFGFKFLENFDDPYCAKSVGEFWRRWHMSLQRFFRDYVYFPMGGSRVNKKSRLIFNMFTVWLLTGIWHGASWNFIAWGLFYFVLLVFEKLTGITKKLKNVFLIQLYRIFTLLCVLFGWVLFRAVGGHATLSYVKSMFTSSLGFIDDTVIFAFGERWFFLILALIASCGVGKKFAKFQEKHPIKQPILAGATQTVLIGGLMFAFIWSISYVILGSHDPFIYFNF
jgi:alginate O-acetyltransferase complex protein AlgI